MEIMDVTFRESVLRSNEITREQLLSFSRELVGLGVDYIDLCYLRCKEEGKLCDRYDEALIRDVYTISQDKCKLSAMMYPDDFAPDTWKAEYLKMLDLIRITTPKDYADLNKLRHIIEYFHDLGLEVSINLLRISEFDREEYTRVLRSMAVLGADYIYLADSNGNLSYKHAEDFVDTLKRDYGCKIGYHGHDNTGQAMLNSVIMLEKGADIIDASLIGYGKGSGNLSLEMFAALCIRLGKGRIRDTVACYRAAYRFNREIVRSDTESERLLYSLLGAFDINYTDTKRLLDEKGEDGDSFLAVCEYLENRQKEHE